jgi:hypothetical protein
MDLFPAHVIELGVYDTISNGVHRATYKNGAFKTQIQPSTDPLDAIRIFIDSPLTTEPEKAKFRATGQKIQEYRHGPRDDRTAFQALFQPMQWLESIFQDDQRRRGIDPSPAVHQRYKADGSVEQTQIFDDDGTVTTMPGGPDFRPGLSSGDWSNFGDDWVNQGKQKADADKKEDTHSM